MTKTTITPHQIRTAPASASTSLLSAKQHKMWAVSKTNNARFKPGTPLGGDGSNAASSSCDGSAIEK
jgi:hypothetical protein